MNTLKLIKEQNITGATFYSIELNGAYLSGSTMFGGDAANTPEELEQFEKTAIERLESLHQSMLERQHREKTRQEIKEISYE